MQPSVGSAATVHIGKQADPTWADHTGTNFGSFVHQEYGERAFSLGFSALRETALARCYLAGFQAKLLIDLD